MAIRRVGMHEAKTQLSQLVRELERGEEIIITRGGTPVARLVPPEPARPFAATRGMFTGELWVADDFNEVDDEISRLFGTAQSP